VLLLEEEEEEEVWWWRKRRRNKETMHGKSTRTWILLTETICSLPYERRWFLFFSVSSSRSFSLLKHNFLGTCMYTIPRSSLSPFFPPSLPPLLLEGDEML